ncbi:AMIN domain-containing protein [Congregibacter litoralis]|uniref:AMIN domain-containing protein n=1 Tax=Congregibacter litoralis TaxID=393662 RepID=UPI00146F954F|nr:AMIN domain-containing protein [Congregibacter litoralis]
MAIALATSPPNARADTPSGSLKSITVSEDSSSAATFILAVDGSIQPPRHFTLLSPPRLVIDLAGTTAKGDVQELSAATAPSLVNRIRLGSHPGPRTRVVFDLHDAPSPGMFTIETKRQSGSQTIVVRFPRTYAVNANNSDDDNPSAREATSVAIKTSATSDSLAAQLADHSKPEAKRTNSTLIFGSDPQPTPMESQRQATPAVTGNTAKQWFIDRALLESGYVRNSTDDGVNTHLQFIAGLTRSISDSLSFRLSARVDGQHQANGLTELQYLRADYDESWLRYTVADWRVTAGAQRIIWGRADEFSPTDKLSTRDFTRLIMDDLPSRRRANPALRVERLWGNRHLDLVYLPTFREAVLPADESVWFPVDPKSGAVAGLPIDPEIQPLLRGARVRNDFAGNEGFALRFSDSGSALDYAVTAQRVNNPEPYFKLASPPGRDGPAVLDVVYPRTWVVGGDAAITANAWTFRGEIAWLSDSPYTDASSLQLRMSEELNWVVGAEVFPNDGDLRITTQLSGRHLLDASNSVDFIDTLNLLGDMETPFTISKLPFRARLRYGFRLDERGNYLNPELIYTALEPGEIYIAAHIFSGTYGTQEGFYADRDTVVIGWRAKF